MLSTGCSKSVQETTAQPTPVPPVAEESDQPNPFAPSKGETEEAPPTATQVTEQPSTPTLPDTELGLESHYFLQSTPPAERLEVIRALGAFQSVNSVKVLARIFAREKRLEAKMKVLEVVADNREDACHEGKLSILRSGVSDSQSRRVRLASLQALLDVDDPRLPQILEQLAKDQDSIIRGQAAEALRK